MTDDDVIAAIARFVAEAEVLPERIRHRASITVLDSLVCAIDGQGTAMTARVAEALSQPYGTVRIPGTALRSAPGAAAHVIALAIASGEFDEANFFADQHPAVHVVPVAYALAAHLGAPLGKMVHAVALGYEVGARFGRASRLRPGVLAHGSHGLFGGVVAAGVLLDLDAAGLERALRLGASALTASTGSARAEGAEGYHAWFGLACERAVSIAFLAQAGIDGGSDALGLGLATILGDGLDRESITRGLGDEYLVEANFFKTYPCCADVQPSLAAVDRALGGRLMLTEQVESVEVRTFAAGCHVLDPHPGSPLLARFSLPWLIASSLVRGPVDETTFETANLLSTDVGTVAERVRVVTDPGFEARFPEELVAEIAIHTVDGVVVEASVSMPPVTPVDTAFEARLVGRATDAFVSRDAAHNDPLLTELLAALRRSLAARSTSSATKGP